MSEHENIWETAVCAHPLVDPDIFYEPVWEWRAKKMCAECPLKNECLLEALQTNQQWGVWGGLNPDERKRLRIRPTQTRR